MVGTPLEERLGSTRGAQWSRPPSEDSTAPLFDSERDTILQREPRERRDPHAAQVLYGETPDQFVAPDKRPKDDLPPRSHLNRAAAPAPDERSARADDDLLGTGADADAGAHHVQQQPPEMDLLGGGDLLGPAAPAPPQPQTRSLVEAAGAVNGELFQAKWGAISDERVITVPTNGAPQGTDMVDAMLASLNVHTMASGELPDMIKFFVYARDTRNALYLVQCIIDKTSPKADLTVKIEGDGDPTFVADIIKQALANC